MTNPRQWFHNRHFGGMKYEKAVRHARELRDELDETDPLVDLVEIECRFLEDDSEEKSRLFRLNNDRGDLTQHDLRRAARHLADLTELDGLDAEMRQWIDQLKGDLHDVQRERLTDVWTIVVDESGSDPINQPGQGGAPFVMAFVVIPPAKRAELPLLPLGYHSKSASGVGPGDLIDGLLDTKGAMAIVWAFEAGRRPSCALKHGGATQIHFEMWKTLPVVLECIAQSITTAGEHVVVETYIERAGGMTPTRTGEGRRPSDLFIGTLSQLLSSTDQRPGWKQMSVATPEIIAKDEHPWLGYADAVAFAMRCRPQLKAKMLRHSNVFVFPFRQGSVRRVLNLLEASSHPLEFTTELVSGTPARDIEDFGELFAVPTREVLEVMSARRWERLINTLEDCLKNNPESYAAANYLLRQWTHLRSEGPLTPEELADTSRLRLLNCMLDAANHEADLQWADELLTASTRLRARRGESSFSTEVLDWNDIARAGVEMNRFNFSNETSPRGALEVVETALADERRKGQRDRFLESVLLSIQMQAHAFLGDLAQALALSDLLLGDQESQNLDARRRHYIYRAHLYHGFFRQHISDGKPERAHAALRNAFASLEEAAHPDPIEVAAADSAYFAALLLKLTFAEVGRAGSDTELRAATENLLKSLVSPLSKLPLRHPFDTLTFWGARLCQRLDMQELALQLAEHLGNFRGDTDHDVVGVIRGCQLEMLIEDGLLEDKRSVEEYWKAVLEASDPRTGKWVKQRSSADGHPLAPLTFNYR